MKTITIDNTVYQIENDKNLLEAIRSAGIDLPTFCYNPELSVYGACRMCMVEVEGRGLVPACSTGVSDGMVIKTNTRQIRNMRKMIVELMLAHHDQNCTTCPKSGSCKLQKLAHDLGVSKVRFKQLECDMTIDTSSASVVRDSSKCILCGDCVRVCREVQGIGVLEFSNRGSDAKVVSGLNQPMANTSCVNCGQCIKACPVGALYPKTQADEVWDAIYDVEKTVVVQMAPAVRVALGENFGFKPGELQIGQMVAALRMLGFDHVYDTSFAADLTVIEEGNEFIERFKKGDRMPQFTSCCPAWVKYAEQFYPDMIPNLSSCKSPQQMFGSLCKDQLTKTLNIPREKLVVVSIMPCTAKKYEAKRPELAVDGNPDVDFVITTQELAQMIRERGIDYANLAPASFDMPFGFKTGAAVIFGTTGGVSEAVLRYAAYALNGGVIPEVKELRESDGIRTVEVPLGDIKLRLAIVSGLANTKSLIEKIRSGEEQYDLVEVMACCGGCVNGGGQPITEEKKDVADRAKGLYTDDASLQFKSAEENPYLKEMYENGLTHEKAHELLHTTYTDRSGFCQE